MTVLDAALGVRRSAYQLSSMKSWNLMGPFVVSASKSGAMEPRRSCDAIVSGVWGRAGRCDVRLTAVMMSKGAKVQMWGLRVSEDDLPRCADM